MNYPCNLINCKQCKLETTKMAYAILNSNSDLIQTYCFTIYVSVVNNIFDYIRDFVKNNMKLIDTYATKTCKIYFLDV